MADFCTILRDAIAGSKADNATNRAALYARAREALEKRLNSLSPPLSAEAQQQQREALEEAVRRIEAESDDAQPIAEDPSTAGNSQPKAPQEKKVKAEARVESTGKAQSKGNGATSAPDADDAGPIASGTSYGLRSVPGLVALLVLAIVANVGAFAYWQWSRVGPPTETPTQRAATDLESDDSKPRPGEAISDVPAAVKKSDTPPSAGIAPVPRQVQTLIVRSDGSVVTFQPQDPASSTIDGAK